MQISFYTEISSHPSQNDNHQENKQQKILAKMQRKSNLYALLVRMLTSIINIETNIGDSSKN
jgi:hypothetical protein